MEKCSLHSQKTSFYGPDTTEVLPCQMVQHDHNITLCALHWLVISMLNDQYKIKWTCSMPGEVHLLRGHSWFPVSQIWLPSDILDKKQESSLYPNNSNYSCAFLKLGQNLKSWNVFQFYCFCTWIPLTVPANHCVDFLSSNWVSHKLCWGGRNRWNENIPWYQCFEYGMWGFLYRKMTWLTTGCVSYAIYHFMIILRRSVRIAGDVLTECKKNG